MTLFDVEELCRYWADFPPLHVIGAAIAGHRRRGDRPPPGRPAVEWVAAELGPGFAVGRVDDGLPPVILAFEQLQIAAAKQPIPG